MELGPLLAGWPRLLDGPHGEKNSRYPPRLGEATVGQIPAELTEALHYSPLPALLRVLEEKGHILTAILFRAKCFHRIDMRGAACG